MEAVIRTWILHWVGLIEEGGQYSTETFCERKADLDQDGQRCKCQDSLSLLMIEITAHVCRHWREVRKVPESYLDLSYWKGRIVKSRITKERGLEEICTDPEKDVLFKKQNNFYYWRNSLSSCIFTLQSDETDYGISIYVSHRYTHIYGTLGLPFDLVASVKNGIEILMGTEPNF